MVESGPTRSSWSRRDSSLHSATQKLRRLSKTMRRSGSAMNSMARSHSAALLHGSTCNIRPGSPHLATVCIAQPLSFVGPKPTTLTASVRQAGMLSVEVCGQRNPSAPSSQRGMPVPMRLHGASAILITRNSARCPPSAHSRELYLSNDERAVAPLQQSERIRGAPIARRPISRHTRRRPRR